MCVTGNTNWINSVYSTVYLFTLRFLLGYNRFVAISFMYNSDCVVFNWSLVP